MTSGQLGQALGFALRHVPPVLGDGASDERFSVLHLFDFADAPVTPEPEPAVTIAPASGPERRSRRAEERFEFRAPREHEMTRDRPRLGPYREPRRVVVELPLDASAEQKRALLAQAELESAEILELEALGLLD